MKQKSIPGQRNLTDYVLPQVDIRLVLKETDALYSTKSIDGPEQASAVMADALKDLDREWVCVVNLNNQLRPINYNVVSIGDLNSAMVPIQNVFKSAILSNAGSIILLHTHPSGYVEPSREDILTTRRMVSAGYLMNIQVLDHLIIGGGSGEIYSLQEHCPEIFEEMKRTMEQYMQEPVEDDYGMSDGIINNGSRQEVPGRQARESVIQELHEKMSARAKANRREEQDSRRNEKGSGWMKESIAGQSNRSSKKQKCQSEIERL